MTRVVLVACLVAAALSLPFIASPLLLDDVAHRAMLEDRIPGAHWGPFDLYDFLGGPGRDIPRLRDAGVVPWFTNDGLSLRFLRPLSSGTLALDAALFGRTAAPARLHSLMWLLVTIAFAAALHRRLLTPRAAPVATLIFAIAGAHAMPVLWIAARHTLVAAAFSLAAFYAHARARTDGSTRALAPAVFAVALLAGEMALGTLALLVAWERLDRRTAPRRLVRLLAPFFALAALYLAVYVGLGYGTRESGAYAATAPTIATLTLALRHWLILLSELASATPSDLLGGSSDAVQWLAAVWGTAVVAIVWLIARVVRPWLDPREPRTLLWMAVAAVAAAAPGALAPVGGRVLTLALVPASGVIGTLLAGGWHALRRSRVTPSRRWLVAAILAGLAFGHLVFSPVVRIGAGVEMTRLGREQYRIAAAVPACGSTIVLIAAADPTLSTYVPAILRLTDRPIQDVRTLSAAAVDHRIERVSATGFDLVTRRNGVEATLWERLYRADSMRPGQVVSVDSFDAKVLEVENGWPTRVRFEFRTPLDTLCFLEWRNGRLEHRRLATDTAVTVPYERGPLGW